MHIGHANSICLNFGVAAEFGGRCHLRFDDTNPVKEEQEFIDAIQADVRWLGFEWGEHLYYASDYFEQLYQWAVHLIEAGLAYVDDLDAETLRSYRGTLTEAGTESPFRDRPVEESLDLFRRMRAGEFPDGARVLRAKIDMAAGNINLRDPVLYRILHATHPRTGDQWCVYPTYDFAHGQSDAIEGVSHSICTLEFADHRPLYDWLIDHLPVRDFISRLSVNKNDGTVELALFENSVREVLNTTAERRMAVIDPLKVVIENYPEGEVEWLEAVNHPGYPDAGTRQIPFAREIYVEREDFMEDPPKKFFRLAPGREVRLRFAYFLTCHEAIKDAAGQVVELRCTYDPATRGNVAPDGRKVKGTIHWVAADHAVEGEARLYAPMFQDPDPMAGDDFLSALNADSLTLADDCKLEPSLAQLPAGQAVQFERLGYFAADPDGDAARPVFNRVVTLRDGWAKANKSG